MQISLLLVVGTTLGDSSLASSALFHRRRSRRATCHSAGQENKDHRLRAAFATFEIDLFSLGLLNPKEIRQRQAKASDGTDGQQILSAENMVAAFHWFAFQIRSSAPAVRRPSVGRLAMKVELCGIRPLTGLSKVYRFDTVHTFSDVLVLLAMVKISRKGRVYY